jgi:glycosyltransferase involved in cell wall biosynthesis
MSDPTYCLITPCRDEAAYARRTIESVLRQTLRPAVWVIVDDGSTDSTPQILAEYAARHDWIRIVRRPDRGDRKLGGGVIDAFNAGLATVNLDDFDFVCKFDLDLEIPPVYFQEMVRRMRENPRIGTCSGKPYMELNGRLVSEKCGDENSVGMIKFYRVDCFRQIGGFVQMLMWDAIDGHRCRMLGWIAVSWDDPEIRFVHLRPMGTSHKNWWTGRVRHGVGQWYMGTGFPYMLASAVYRLPRPPVIVGGVAMLWGYIRSAIQRAPRISDPEFRKFLTKYQWSCLFRGKAATTRAFNEASEARWKPSRAQPAASGAP